MKLDAHDLNSLIRNLTDLIDSLESPPSEIEDEGLAALAMVLSLAGASVDEELERRRYGHQNVDTGSS